MRSTDAAGSLFSGRVIRCTITTNSNAVDTIARACGRTQRAEQRRLEA
jgi:hypothetical protein